MRFRLRRRSAPTGPSAPNRRGGRDRVDDVAERPSRTIRNAAMAPAAHSVAHGGSAQQIARGVVLGVADDGDAAAVGARRFALGHGVDGVVGALAVDVGPQQLEQRRRRSARERSRRSRRRAAPRPARRARPPAGSAGPAPSAPRRRIVVDRHDQPVGFRGRGLQIADVADVQQVEAAVGERDRPPGARDRRATALGERARVTGASSTTCRSGSAARSSSADDRRGAALHHHDAAGVVGQPRRLLERRARRPAPASSSR